MDRRIALCCTLLLLGGLGAGDLDTAPADSPATSTLVDAPKSQKPVVRLWPSQPPADCPFPPSDRITGLAFTGRHAEYTNADTWYPSWASDGSLYSPWTDGSVNGVGSSSAGPRATTGQARILGDDPLNLKVTDAATYASSPAPYGGRYPCGSLVYNGVWYYGTYCLMNEGGSLAADYRDPSTGEVYNWGVLGPFVGFRVSRDFGRTWTETPHTPARPLFPEPSRQGGAVKIGSPHFVDFGRNLEHSPDGKAYLVAHGAVEPDPKPRKANLSWITGDQIYLVRVTPTPENLNDASKYEYFTGRDAQGRPRWSRDFGQLRPLVDWNNHCGCVTMTYNAPLRKYLMCVTDGWPTRKTFDTWVLESDRVTGPFRRVSYLRRFGQQGYFVSFPSKFISADGRTAWLCYAANFTGAPNRSDPPGSRYGMCLQEVRLAAPGDVDAGNPLHSPDNLAPGAVVTASSTHDGYSARGAVDGVVGGFPGDTHREWATQGEADTALLRLTWDEEQTIDRVWLFDRPNALDQVTSGMLVFSDGSTVPVGPLPDDAARGREVRFPPRKVKWLLFVVSGTRPGSPNIGLSEIAVFRSGSAPRQSRPLG